MDDLSRNDQVNQEPENIDPTMPPKQHYLDQLQQDAIDAALELESTEGEKIIRQGLQAWPDLIDQELKRFKQRCNDR